MLFKKGQKETFENTAAEEVVIEEPVIKKEAPKPKKFVPIAKTTIGSGVTFVGNFETTDPLEINGAIQGDISSKDTVEINPSGKYTGNAEIQDLLLHGEAEGNLVVDNLTKLTTDSVMRGTLSTSRLVTEDGSSFEGDMKLRKKKPEVKPAPAPAPEASATVVPAEKPAEVKPAEVKPAEKKLPPLQEGDVEVDEDFLFGKH